MYCKHVPIKIKRFLKLDQISRFPGMCQGTHPKSLGSWNQCLNDWSIGTGGLSLEARRDRPTRGALEEELSSSTSRCCRALGRVQRGLLHLLSQIPSACLSAVAGPASMFVYFMPSFYASEIVCAAVQEERREK